MIKVYQQQVSEERGIKRPIYIPSFTQKKFNFDRKKPSTAKNIFNKTLTLTSPTSTKNEGIFSTEKTFYRQLNDLSQYLELEKNGEEEDGQKKSIFSNVLKKGTIEDISRKDILEIFNKYFIEPLKNK